MPVIILVHFFRLQFNFIFDFLSVSSKLVTVQYPHGYESKLTLPLDIVFTKHCVYKIPSRQRTLHTAKKSA